MSCRKKIGKFIKFLKVGQTFFFLFFFYLRTIKFENKNEKKSSILIAFPFKKIVQKFFYTCQIIFKRPRSFGRYLYLKCSSMLSFQKNSKKENSIKIDSSKTILKFFHTTYNDGQRNNCSSSNNHLICNSSMLFNLSAR